MSTELLTVRQIAEIIQRPREELATVIDRIRYWTDEGLLKVSGDLKPGTGKKRLYEPSAIIDAIVMTALTDVGLAAIRVSQFAAANGMTVLGFGRMGACEVLDPKKPISPAFLTMSGPTLGPYSVTLANSGTTLFTLTGGPEAPWSIILNLVHYFKPLRGVVSAVLEHGYTKIELCRKET